MDNKLMKKCSTSLAVKERQIKTTYRFQLTPVGMDIIDNTNNRNGCEDVQGKEHFNTVGGNVN
jgi:hypothetical protein